jgi:hypothetical protein
MSLNDIVQPLIGGALIGLVSTLLLLVHGRIAGISGICGAVLIPGTADWLLWRFAFIVWPGRDRLHRLPADAGGL